MVNKNNIILGRLTTWLHLKRKTRTKTTTTDKQTNKQKAKTNNNIENNST